MPPKRLIPAPSTALAIALAVLPLFGCQLILPKHKQPLPAFEIKNELDATIEDSEDLAFNLQRFTLPERTTSVLSDLFPKGVKRGRLLSYFQDIGGTCGPVDAPNGKYSCSYCTVKYDQVFDYGWKLRRLEVLWELDAIAEKPSNALEGQANEERRLVGLSFRLIVAGGGILPSSLDDPDLSSCDDAASASRYNREKPSYLGTPFKLHSV